MKVRYEGEYKITELDSGAVIKEINQDKKPTPIPVKPGADLNIAALKGTATGKALLVILRHFDLI